MWQEMIVGFCVLAALAFVLRKYVFKSKTAAGSSCGGCNGCDNTKKACAK